ncbi:MAG: hypothetical protein ABSB40_02075 [Nitrososphaeria archaeon]
MKIRTTGNVIDKMSVLVFLGTVGVGKSTQIRLLESRLKSDGFKVRKTFLKTNHLLAYLLNIFLVELLVKDKEHSYPIRTLIENKPELTKKILRLWLTLDLISLSILFFLKIFIPIKRGRIVIVEEYFPAAISDYMYLARSIGYPIKDLSFAINYMQKLSYLGGSYLIIFLDTNTKDLLTHWMNRNIRAELYTNILIAPDYIGMQRSVLLNISKKLCSKLLYLRIDNKTIKEIQKIIIEFLNRNWKYLLVKDDANKK